MEKYTYLTSEDSEVDFLDWLNVSKGVRTPLYQKAIPISNDLLKLLEEAIAEKLMANKDRYPLEHMSKFISIENGSLKMPICEKIIRDGQERIM